MIKYNFFFASLIWLIFLIPMYAQAPINDNCNTASLLQISTDHYCNNSIEQSTLGATDSGLPNACGGNGDDDVWYKFEVTNIAMRLNIFSTSYPNEDLVVQLFTGQCGSLDSLTCNRPSLSGITDFGIDNLAIGDTLYMRIFEAGTSNAGMNFYACVYPPPYNDNCIESNEILLSYLSSACIEVDGYGATDSGITSDSCAGNPDDDVWYKFTAISNIQIIEFTSGNNTSIMELRNGPCSTSMYFDCAEIPDDEQPHSIVSSNFVVDSTYYIRIFSSDTGTFTYGGLCISAINYEPEDNCETAELLMTNTYEYGFGSGGNLLASTPTTLPISTCNPGPYYDLWYKFVATSTRHIAEVVSQGDVIVEAFTGNNCNSLSAIDCTNEVSSTARERLDLQSLTIGDTIFIRVYDASNTAAMNTFSIYIMTPPDNDFCTDATLINTTNGVTCNNPEFGITRIATGQGGCSGHKADDDVWYKFEATDTLHLITISNTSLNCSCDPISMPAIEVLKGDCSGASIVCSQNYSTLLTSLSIDSIYYIRVYSSDSLSGNGYFNICISEPPANVFCNIPDTLSINDSTICSTSYLGNSIGLGDLYSWFTFTATQTSHIFYTTPISPVTAIGSSLELFDEECNFLDLIGYDYYSGVQRMYYHNFTIGNQYKIKVSAGYPTEGPFEICITNTIVNDNCADAIEIPTNLDCSCTFNINGSCEAATPSIFSGGCHPQQMDVWYKFMASSNQSIITLTGTNGSVNLGGQLFGPDSCNAAPLGCFSFGNFTANNLEAGKIYFLRIIASKSDGSPSTFNLCIKNISNDFCSNPRILIPSLNTNCATPVIDSTYNATSSNTIYSCTNDTLHDVWFKFVATSAKHWIRVIPISEGFDPVVGLFRQSTSGGSCNTGCFSSNHSCVNTTHIDYQPEDLIASDLIIGASYLIRVNGTNSEGIFSICVTSPGTIMQVLSTEKETYCISGNCSQSTSFPEVAAGTWKYPIKRMKLNLTGTSSPISITKIIVNTNGTSNTSDLLSAKLYYSNAVNTSSPLGSNSDYNTMHSPGSSGAPVLFGNAIANPNGTLTFNGTQIISGTSNPIIYNRYFFLVLDVACDADTTNIINAEITSMTIGGIDYAPFIANNFGIGIDSFMKHETIANGNWSDDNIWMCGMAPPNLPSNKQVEVFHNVTVSDSVQTGSVHIHYTSSVSINNTGVFTMGASSMGNANGHSNKFLFSPNGNLMVDGGILNVNGSLYIGNYLSGISYGSLNLINGGEINIDGNDGINDGTSYFKIFTKDLSSIGGGFINILDPGKNQEGGFFYNSPSGPNMYQNWEVKFGGGDDIGGNYGYGFEISCTGDSPNFPHIKLEKIIVDGGMQSENRNVEGLAVCRNFEVNSNCEYIGDIYCSNDIQNNGCITGSRSSFNSGKIVLADNFTFTNFLSSGNAQSINGSGVFRMNTSVVYPVSQADNNFGSLIVSNSNSAGIVLGMPLAITNSLLLKNGTVFTSDSSILTLGSAGNFGILAQSHPSFNYYSATEFTEGVESWTGGIINGPFRRFLNKSTPAYKSIMPLGKDGIKRPLAIRFNHTHPTYAISEYFKDDPTNLCVPIFNEQNLDISNVSPTGYWKINAPKSCGNYEIDFKTTNFVKRGSGSISDLPNLRVIKRLDGFDWANSCSPNLLPPTSLNKVTFISSNQKVCNTDSTTSVVLKINSAYYNKNVSWEIKDENSQIVYSGGPVTCGSQSSNLSLSNGCYSLNINISFDGNSNSCVYYDTLFTLYDGSDLVHYGLQNLFTANHQFQFCFNKGNIDLYPNNCKALLSDFALGGANGAVGSIVMPSTHYVTNDGDSGIGTLRYLLETAICNDTIRFDPSINGDTIILLTHLQMIDKNVVIIAEPSQNISVQIVESKPIFEINAQNEVHLSNLKLIANEAYDGYIIENSGNLKINSIETSSSGISIHNKTIINNSGAYLEFYGVNIFKR